MRVWPDRDERRDGLAQPPPAWGSVDITPRTAQYESLAVSGTGYRADGPTPDGLQPQRGALARDEPALPGPETTEKGG